MTDPFNVLAIVRGGMGDLVLTLPLLQGIHAANARARITVLATNIRCLDAARFMQGRSVVDAVVDWRDLQYQSLFKGDASGALLDLLSQQQLILTTDVEDQRPAQALGRWLGKLNIEPPRLAVVDYRPLATEKLLRMSEVLVHHAHNAGVLMRPDPIPRIGMPGVGTLPHVVVLAPGCGEVLKCWPVAGWLTLAEWHKSRDRYVLWALGPQEAEHPMFAPIYQRAGLDGETVLSDGTLTERMAQIARAGMYVGGDSGVTHIAAACGVPRVLCVWNEFGAKQNFPFWASPCPNVTHVMPDSPLNPPLEKVIAEVE